MRSMIAYFNCGGVYKRKDGYDFRFMKFTDLNEKIIPFFNNPSLV